MSLLLVISNLWNSKTVPIAIKQRVLFPDLFNRQRDMERRSHLQISNKYFQWQTFSRFEIILEEQKSIAVFLLISILVQLRLDYDQISNQHRIMRCSTYQREELIRKRCLFLSEYEKVRHLLEGGADLRPGIYQRKYSMFF